MWIHQKPKNGHVNLRCNSKVIVDSLICNNYLICNFKLLIFLELYLQLINYQELFKELLEASRNTKNDLVPSNL
jgi:hypothetical protein